MDRSSGFLSSTGTSPSFLANSEWSVRTFSQNAFSPFSPMSTDQSHIASNTTTPRRRLSLSEEENTTQPSWSVMKGYDGSVVRSISNSVGSCHDEMIDSCSPLSEIKPSSLNSTMAKSQRKTLLARRLMKRQSSTDLKDGNSTSKCVGVLEPLSFVCSPTPRPSSLPTLPVSPLIQDQGCSSDCLLTQSLNSTTLSSVRQINSPLERMSLVSPTGSLAHKVHGSIASSNNDSDGYFSEVFDAEDTDDAEKPVQFLLFSEKVSKEGVLCPTPVRSSNFTRSDSWSQANSSGRESDTPLKRSSLKRSSPCVETYLMQKAKRPPLPFVACTNSQDSTHTTAKPLKGTPLLRSYSCCMAPILSPTSPTGEDTDLIGDFSKPYALPVVIGCSEVIKFITPETLSKVISGQYKDVIVKTTIIDCRYPYEYYGGHIEGAINIWEKDTLLHYFFDSPQYPNGDGREIYVFHCEFSSKRGPEMSKFLRKMDRQKNGLENFPKLYYPEVYLLHRGYKGFFQEYSELCEPQNYRCMLDERHKEDLKHFKQRSKSWAGETQSRRRATSMRTRKTVIACHSLPISNTVSSSQSSANSIL